MQLLGLGALFGGLGSLGLGGAMLLKGGKKPKQPLPQATRDDAAAIAADDELRRRKGGAADIITGATGAEAALSGGKMVLGS